MASKEATPVASDAANTTSPTKKEETVETKPLLTSREEELFKVAMIHCLKTGPPAIDYEKFMKHGNFNTLKTAQNTWGKIKAKLPKPEVTEDEEGGAPKTPAKAKSTPKKRAKKAEGEDDAGGSPKKKAKTPAKKVKKEETEVKAEEEED